MNIDAIEKMGTAPLNPLLKLVHGVNHKIGALMHLIGSLQKYQVYGFFGFRAEIDSSNPKVILAAVDQGGLSLPDQVYYTEEKYKETIDKYLVHIENMFKLFGISEAAKHAENVVALETALAEITTPHDDLIDPESSFNKVDFIGLVKLAPKIPWDIWRKAIGRPDLTQIAIDAVDFFEKLGDTLLEHSDKWESYMTWKIIHKWANVLPKNVVQEDFEFFGKVLSGLKEMSPRNRTCIKLTDRYLGELVGVYFADRKFSEDSKQRAKDMIRIIEAAFEESLEALEWMDVKTREQANIKAKKISNMVGYPDKPKEYKTPLNRNTLAANVFNLAAAAFMDEVNTLQKASNKDKWEMSPSTVNAYYDPTKNQIVFPAGILQAPYYDGEFPPVMNYGGIGMVVGHEITHGFDNQGSHYDGDGKLENWWEKETSDRFQEKVDCVIDQYNHYEVLPGYFINGNLTQGENIADMGGIKISYNGFVEEYKDIADKPSIVPEYTNKQLFFISFAQSWCSKYTDEFMKVKLLTDPHSPPEFRVKGPLSNFGPFAENFQCAPGSGMNPDKKCAVW